MQKPKTPTKSAAALPSDHAFVVQFRAQPKGKRVQYTGRVEHLVSGQATHFYSRTELQEFIAKILTSRSGQPP
jgi:hypothetical protein